VFTTTKDGLIAHLKQDLGIKKNDLVFMHSGITGLGRLEQGLETITAAWQEVLPEGLLVIPTFTYSWCEGKPFDPLVSECPASVGSYSQHVWKDPRFVRSSDPNFSVAALKNALNGKIIEKMFKTGRSCFGTNSVFDHMVQLALDRDAYIMLLGGAHSDCVFRTTFIHHVEEKVGVPNRYLKKFYHPENKNDYVEQLVRFFSFEEYRQATGREDAAYDFPIRPDYALLGEDLIKDHLVVSKPLAYSRTRMVPLRAFCDYVERKLKDIPDYFVHPPTSCTTGMSDEASLR